MSDTGYPIPILLLVFNRPELTRRTFSAIKAARPRKLYIAADGPRSGVDADQRNCMEVRAIVDQIDWPCQVRTLFREANQGCRNAVSSAIDWFFDDVEYGVILEDDCLPTGEFFSFCEALLEYYKEDRRIMQIAGVNLCEAEFREDESYTFSKYTPIWGWATWRRAWKHYDVNMEQLAHFKRERSFKKAFPGWEQRLSRSTLYELVRQGKIDTWDYQWNFAVVANEGISVIPVNSLVKNIGFGGGATHTKSALTAVKSRNSKQRIFPLQHPKKIAVNREYDINYFNMVTKTFSPTGRLLMKRFLPVMLYSTIKRLLSNP